MTSSGLMLTLILFAFAILLGFTVYGMRYFFANMLNKHGAGAEKITRRILLSYALIRGFKVISGVRIRFKGKTCDIENMLIGHFGILLFRTLGGIGEYYGQLDGKEWQRVLDNKKYGFPNPAADLDEAVSVLRGFLSANKIFGVPIESFVVLTSRAKKTALFISNDNRILLPGRLKPLLRKTKYDYDAGVDVTRVASAVEEGMAKQEPAFVHRNS